MPGAIAFHANLHRAREVQEEVLLCILRRDPAFASIRSVREFQERVPVRTYDEYGDITPPTPITHYETTSGSSGASKRIPYTRELRAEMNRAIAPWIVDLFRAQPGAFAGEAYWSVSPVLGTPASPPAEQGASRSRPPAAGRRLLSRRDAGAPSDEDHLGPVRARLVRAVQAVPRDVRFLRDVETFRRVTLDYLLRCESLSLISVWHPSFLLLLLGGIRENPWPKLRVISCWSDANAARDAAELARIFPGVHIQPKGLLSTEGFVSIPLADDAHALAYRSHFYELRDVETNRVLPATEGEPGRRYAVVLTTGAGLYRYDTEDLVEIAGYREACPLLRFVGRERHISDHYGEKLNELFVRERLDHVLRELPVRFAMLACEERAYTLFIECDALPADVAPRLDARLRENVHYDYCRRLGQLDELRVLRVVDGAATYLANAGPRLGDVKLTSLDARTGWAARFRSAG